MGILDLLKKDHDKVKQLYAELTKLSADETAKQKELFRELKKEIIAHSHAEEDVFYTHIQKSMEDQDLIDTCYSDHEEVEDFLDDIDDQIASNNDWLTTLSSMMASLNSHIEMEEGTVFVKARSILSSDEEDRLGQDFKQAKEDMNA